MKRYLGVVTAAVLLGGMVTVASDALAAGHGGGGGGFRGGHIGGGHIGGGVGGGHIGGRFVGGPGFAGRGGGLPYGNLRSGPLVTGLPSGHLRSGRLVTGLPSGRLATLFGLFGAGRYSGFSSGQGSPLTLLPLTPGSSRVPQKSPITSLATTVAPAMAARVASGGGAYGGGYAGGTNTHMAQNCLAAPVTDVPIDQIRQTVHPTREQQAALDGLIAASSQANDIVEAACPTEPTLSPVGRLDAAEKQYEAVVRAAQILRSPVEKFYASLSDEQKATLNTTGESPQNSSSQAEDQRDDRGTEQKSMLTTTGTPPQNTSSEAKDQRDDRGTEGGGCKSLP